VGQLHPVEGNRDGSYLTMTSKGVGHATTHMVGEEMTKSPDSVGNSFRYNPYFGQLWACHHGHGVLCKGI
jgi:hypothetical protein